MSIQEEDMKKRLTAAFLAVLMLVSCVLFAGCGKEEEPESNAGQRVAMTMTLWLQAGKDTEVDKESVAQVEKAINEITQAQFSTAIKLKVFTADDYDSNVLMKIENCRALTEDADRIAAEIKKAQREAAARGEEYIPDPNLVSTVEVLDFDDEDNMFEAMNAALFASYPAVANNQFDIFLIHGYEEFEKLASAMQLADLHDNLSDESKILKSYIFPSLLEGAQYDGCTYAIPNNRAVGEYEVMLVNKKIASDLYYDPSEFTSVQSLFEYDDSGISFIEDVKNTLPDVTPVAGTFSAPYIKYWNADDDDSFSILSSLVSKDMDYLDVSVMNTFKNINFVNSTLYSKRINEIAAPVAFDPSLNFAVGFTTATSEEIDKYSEKYQVAVIQNPKPSQEEIFDSMFAVSSYTKDVDRAMEVITLLNTDTELRTILQYGVKGVHWKYDVDDDSVITILSDKYKMDIKETGNSYMTYPAEGVPMSEWKHAKAQNIDSFVPKTTGFIYYNEETGPILDQLKVESERIYKKISAMSSTEFNDSLEALRDEVDNLECVKKLTYMPKDEEEPEYNYEESIAYEWIEFLNR